MLLTIASYDRETMKAVEGLLFENIGLGSKRRLQKIQKWLIAEFAILQTDCDEAAKSENSADEIAKLLDETIKSDIEPVLMSEIEKIQTDKNYDFEIIEMIAQ